MKTINQFLNENVKLTASIEAPHSEMRYMISPVDLQIGSGEVNVQDDLHNENHLVFYQISKDKIKNSFELVIPGKGIFYINFRIEHPNTGERIYGRKRAKRVHGKDDLEYKKGWRDDHIVFGTPDEHVKTRVVRIPFIDILKKILKNEKPNEKKYILYKSESSKIKSVINNLIKTGNDAMNLMNSDHYLSKIVDYFTDKYSSKEKTIENAEIVSVPSKLDIKKEVEERYGTKIINWRQLTLAANKSLKDLYPNIYIDGKIMDMPEEFWQGKDRGQGVNRSYFIVRSLYKKGSSTRVLEPIADWYERESK